MRQPLAPCRRLVLGAALALAAVFATGKVSAAAEVHEHVLGDPAAPITMIEYSSLTCPHCGAFHTETLPTLKKEWIDTGKVKLVVRDFPLDQNALKAAVLAHCAGDRFFQFFDVFFAQQRTWARSSDPVAALKQLARLGGLSEEQADACLADQAMADAVLQIRLDGQKEFNIESTPTFIINGKAYPGNRTPEEFAEIFKGAGG
ncbi:MAG: DsbA family protein [Geminicoccaceae bacterium]